VRRSSGRLALAALLSCAAPAREAPPAAAGPDRTVVPPLAPPPALRMPSQERFTLPGGLRVRLVEYRRLPIVALHLVVEAGAVSDPPGRPGVASFTAAMLTEGTRSRTATQISDEVAALGAHLGAGAGSDAAQLSASALSRHLDPLLALFADVLVNPAFAEADFARLQDQRLVALRQQRDQPGIVAGRAFAAVFWGEHPYGHPALGTEESLRAFTREELAAFHRRHWRPGNAELVVVGDVTRGELEPRLVRALAGWTGSAPSAGPARAPPQPVARTVLVEKRGAPQAFLLLGTPGFARARPGKAAADVAFQILGGGTASRLFRRLREEKGLTYGMGAGPEARKLGGTAIIAGSVKADRVGEALQLILAEIADLRDRPVSEEELRTAVNGTVLSLPAEFATAGGIAGRLADTVIHGLPDGYWPSYAAEASALTAADVQRAAREWLDPERITAVLVGDLGQVRPQLQGLALGPVELREAGR
jgi:zinc protease